MSSANSTGWQHANKFNVESFCKYCEGALRHEPWCVAVNLAVAYAYEILLDARKLTLGDRLILHALGVVWVKTSYKCEAG